MTVTDTDTEKDASAKKSATPTYTVDRLVADSEGFLGVESHVAVGALHGHDGPFTLDEAKKLVEKWMAKTEDKG